MKKVFSQFCRASALVLFVVSCSPDNDVSTPLSKEPDESEIALLEKEEGVTFFKTDVSFESGDSKAVLRIATRNEDFFNYFVEHYDVSIIPVYANDPGKNTSGNPGGKVIIPQGEKLMTEFVEMVKGKGVISFKTHIAIKDHARGRTKLGVYDFYVEHTSGNWPSNFVLDFPQSGGGVFFEAKRKWYNGWEGDTNCITSGYGVGTCENTFDGLPGTIRYTFDVDGPWRSRATIGYDVQSGTIDYEYN